MSVELIPVSERLPESDKTLCVIWVIDDYDFAWWYAGTNCWDSPDNGWIEADKVTYWLPLPDKPNSKGIK